MLVYSGNSQSTKEKTIRVSKPDVTQTIRPSEYSVQYKLLSGVRSMRVMVGFGVVAMAYFLGWFVTPKHIGYAPLFWLLTISLGFKMLRMLHEWAHYVQVREPVAPAPARARLRTVDVLTTACPGEPHDMIVRTLESMQALNYPHTSYLCDEGDDPYLRRECERLGVVHVTRQDKVNAKAGNINNALRQATGEFCVVLDPDHVLAPDFLDHVMPYFEDSKIGFVQVVQAYGNQQESLVAQGAAEQTYHFYGPLMMGMNGYGTVQAIGANCTFRRAALNSIGGHAAGLTEDMHTAMRLHAEGWQSAYVPKVLSRGLVPSSLGAFYAQQLKWARGAFELLLMVYPKLWSRFTWAQRLHYFTLPLYFFSGVITLIDIAVPIAALTLAKFPWYVPLQEFAVHMLPLWAISLLIRCYAQQWLREPHERGLHLVGGFLRVGTWWVYTLGFVYALLRVRVPYIPTPKAEGWLPNEWRVALPNLVAATLLLGACKLGRMQSLATYTHVMVALSLLLAGILLAAAALGQHEMLRNFMRDMASKPFRPLVLWLNRSYEGITRMTGWRLRQSALGLSVGAGGLAAIVQLLMYFGAITPMPHITWAKTGGLTVHSGVSIDSPTPEAALPDAAGASGLATYKGNDIITVAMDGNALPQWPKEVLNQLPPTQVPLLTWPVPAEAKSIEQWQYIARQLKQASSRTIMLRPIFPVQSPVAFRRAWRDMVKGFAAEQVYNVVWLWTPPRPEALSAYFPGAAYLDWMVADHPAEQANVSYAGIRHQAAQQFELHRKPVMLLATLPAGGATANTLARRVASEYPEIRAVVYDNYVPARTALVPQPLTPLQRTQKPTVPNAVVVREKLTAPTASKG